MSFLTAKWQDLVIINWRVDPSVLLPYLPAGTQLDYWNEECYLSLVAFRFLDTKVLGLHIPFHTNFEEINLRFYVKRETKNETRSGVVFIKEIVPRFWIALIARLLYNENYVCGTTSGIIKKEQTQIDLQYFWKSNGTDNSVRMIVDSELQSMVPGSHEEFIAEHYWGYCRQRNGKTIEYNVKHPRWQIIPSATVSLNIEFEEIYGQELGQVLRSPPRSAFYARGSEVSVGFGEKF